MIDPAPTSAQLRHAMLQELAEIGMELARDLRDQQKIEPRPDAGLVYARIARAVRQTLALQARLEAEAKVETVRTVRANADGKKAQVSHIITDLIEDDDDAGDAETVERLTSLYEHLADADDADFADKSIPEIVAQVCHDLGVPFDPERWDPPASAYLPRVAAGGGPPAEEPGVEGASPRLRPHPSPS
jgi:hypothetical protein